MEINDLLDEIDRRLFDLQTFLASDEGLGNNVFDQIVLTDSSGTPTYVIDHVASPPTGLTIVPGVFYNDVYADVSWTAPADGSAIAYDVEWAKRDGSAGSYTYELINASRVHGNSFRIPALEAGTWYGVRLSGVNRAGFISSTLPATGFQDFRASVDASVPNPPTGLVVFGGLKSLVVRWDDNGEPDVAKGAGTYLVQVATDNAFATIVKQEFVSGTVATFVDLSSNTTYYVRVYAIDQSGNQSPVSATASGTTGQAVSQDLIDGAVTATKMQAGSANLLMDSSFEGTNLARYWTDTTGRWVRSTTAPMHGTAMAHFSTALTSGWTSLSQTINIIPSSPLTVTFLYKMSANMVQAHFKLDYYDINNNVLSGSSWQPLGGTNGPVAQTVVVASNTAPDTAVKAVVSCMGGWSSDGAAATFDIDGIYICALTALPTGVTWAPAGPEIMPAMVFGDMLVANAVQVWNMAANSVNANAIIANSINSNHIAVVGLDAGVILFGTMSGARVTANTADIAILKTSSLTTQTITLNGGTLKAGNPPTTGLLLNSQGLRLYAGGVQTLTLDSATGAATFGGTVSSSATISGSTITGATITTGNYTITPSQFAIVAATTYSDTRAIRWTGAGGLTQARIWVYDAGNLGKTYNGDFHFEANNVNIAGDVYRLANAAQTQTYITIFPNNASATGNVILGSGSAGSQVSVSAGSPMIVGSTGTPVMPAFEARGYSGLFDNSWDVGIVIGGNETTVRVVGQNNAYYQPIRASAFWVTSDPSEKDVLDPLAPGEGIRIVSGTSRPYRFKWKEPVPADKKNATKIDRKIRVGVSSTDMPPEVQQLAKIRKPDAPPVKGPNDPNEFAEKNMRDIVQVDAQVEIAILWAAVQDLIKEVDSLKAAA